MYSITDNDNNEHLYPKYIPVNFLGQDALIILMAESIPDSKQEGYYLQGNGNCFWEGNVEMILPSMIEDFSDPFTVSFTFRAETSVNRFAEQYNRTLINACTEEKVMFLKNVRNEMSKVFRHYFFASAKEQTKGSAAEKTEKDAGKDSLDILLESFMKEHDLWLMKDEEENEYLLYQDLTPWLDVEYRRWVLWHTVRSLASWKDFNDYSANQIQEALIRLAKKNKVGELPVPPNPSDSGKEQGA